MATNRWPTNTALKPGSKRIRGRRLQRIRAAHFAIQPLCVHCLAKGRVRIATELDHILALVNGGQDVPSNRQGLCNACHEAKTIKDLGLIPRTAFGLDGEPIDPQRGWGGYLRSRKA